MMTLFDILIIVYAISILFCLIKLAQLPRENFNAIWALIIIFIPLIGALIFLIYGPKRVTQG